MIYEVIIMPSAKADIFEIRAWLLENFPQNADDWLWSCSQAVTSLRKNPRRCRVSEESAAFDVEVRELLFGNKRNVYRLMFAIADGKVSILRVRSTRQQRLVDQFED